MKVRAIRMGYFNNKRVREGEVFDFPEDRMKKEPKTGKILSPSWVEVFTSAGSQKKGKGQKPESESEDAPSESVI